VSTLCRALDTDEFSGPRSSGSSMAAVRQASSKSADDRRAQFVGVQTGGAERVAIRDARLAIPGGEEFGRPAVAGRCAGPDANPIAVDRENHEFGHRLAEITTRHPDRALHRLSHR
jgi:hypothetical protein